MTVRTLLSRSGGSDGSVDLTTWHPREIRDGEMLWIDVMAPTDDERALVTSALSLRGETIETLTNGAGHPDGHVLDDGILVAVHTIGDDVTQTPIVLHILIGADWALTWHSEPIAFLDEHHTRIQDQREVGRLTSPLLLVAMLDWHLDTFYAAADDLEHEIDELDEVALRGDDKNMLARLVDMRRRIAQVRRLLNSHRDMYSEVGRPDFIPDIEPREAEALASLIHRLERATDTVANAREMLIGSFDVHMTRTAQRTNDIMRVLTLVSVTLLPAAVLAGVMGMNFKVGFFENSNMFWVVVATMLVFALAAYAIARRRDWLSNPSTELPQSNGPLVGRQPQDRRVAKRRRSSPSSPLRRYGERNYVGAAPSQPVDRSPTRER
jgi:magnesium transporter